MNVRAEAAILGCLALHPLPHVLAQAASSAPPDAYERSTERVVHSFDFDERDEGNLEDVPKFWEMYRPPGFPHYAHGAFDLDVGHQAPPSFHLSSEGRNVAFHYGGPDTRVRTNSEYRIEAYLKPDGLDNGRACLSAHFLDRFGRILPDTLIRSRWVGGAGKRDWERVDLYLAAAPHEAFGIGLIAWVGQETVWNQEGLRPRHIAHRDVLGGAWFDDVVIYRLPRVELHSSSPGNVLSADGPQHLLVILADHDDRTLEGVVSIFAADGGLVETHNVEVELRSDADPRPIDVGHLEPGLYRAQFDIRARGARVLSRSLRFARLAPRLGRPEALARSFGVVIDPVSRSDLDTEEALLMRQHVHSLKLPVWSGLPKETPAASERRALDRLLRSLVRNNFVITAVLHGAPGPIARRSIGFAPSLIDLLSTAPERWEQHVAQVAAPYAGTFRWWQIGSEGSSDVLYAERGADVADNLRAALRPFITDPQLAAPASALTDPPSAARFVDRVTINLPEYAAPEVFDTTVAVWVRAGFEDVDVHLPLLLSGGFDRLSRLADWAQRLIIARHAGARTVFVPQTWHTRTTPAGRITEPDERYVLLRTLADLIGDAEPGPVMSLADGVVCKSFRHEGSSVLAIWGTNSGARTRRLALQLGRAARRVDLWGRVAPLERDESGRQILDLTSMPVLIDGVESWLVELASSLSVTPSQVESGAETTRLMLEWAYRGDQSVAGRVRLVAPKGWTVWPREFDMRWNPMRVERIGVDVRFSPNETAGLKTIVARVRLSDSEYLLEIPIRIELRLEGLAVWGMTYVDGDQLILRHAVTNVSPETVHFRSVAGVPGHERQYRPFTDLRPGDTQTATYRFQGGRALIGRKIRLALRELNDGRRAHYLELAVP